MILDTGALVIGGAAIVALAAVVVYLFGRKAE